MVTIDGISKSFGDVHAVSDISFQVKDGEVVGLLGPNGAGKTTTMRIATGYLAPDSGRVVVNGKDIAEFPQEVQKDIGYMPENNPLYRDMLVSEFLAFTAALRGLEGTKKRTGIGFAVGATNIADVYHWPIKELSKGYRQRVGLAATLLHKPKILILDEPTEGLDPNQRTEVRHVITSLAKDHTVIVSTHVLGEVEAVCSRLIIIHKGKLVADGTPRSLMHGSTHARCLLVTLEGEQIAAGVKRIKGIDTVEVLRTRGKKSELRLYYKDHTSVQPELSRMAATRKWIIWKLTEETQSLEDVFSLLTKES